MKGCLSYILIVVLPMMKLFHVYERLPLGNIGEHQYFSKLLRNPKAFTSKFLENYEERSPW